MYFIKCTCWSGQRKVQLSVTEEWLSNGVLDGVRVARIDCIAVFQPHSQNWRIPLRTTFVGGIDLHHDASPPRSILQPPLFKFIYNGTSKFDIRCIQAYRNWKLELPVCLRLHPAVR